MLLVGVVMPAKPYQSKERVNRARPFDPSSISALVKGGQKFITEYQRRDLIQRNSEATIKMLNVETSITNKLVDIQTQLDEDGEINGVPYTKIAEQIRLDEYKGFTPPPELKDKYNEQQAKYQAAQAVASHASYGAIKERKIKDDFRKTYGDIAILTTRETADENIEKITLLVDNMGLSETHYKSLLRSSIEGHNNQMYRNEINNPDNNIEQIKLQHKEFKKNRYGVGLENHKTIDRLFISKIKTKKAANTASDRAQKRYQVEQTMKRVDECIFIDSTGEGCDFKAYINDPDYSRNQQEKMDDFENIQKSLRPLVINMAAGYSENVDRVRSSLHTILADEKVSRNARVKAKKALNYMDTQRSQFEAKIRQPDGIDFVIAQLNKGDDTDIMNGAEPLSAEWMGKANSIMSRIGVLENERILLPREVREQLATDPFTTVESILDTAEQEDWDDTSRRVVIKEMNKVTGLPKGMSILLSQDDNTRGIRALKNYKNNKELYKKSDPFIKFDTDIIFESSTDPTRETLRLSGFPVEDIVRFDNAIKIQTLSTWETTGGEIDEIFTKTYQEIVDKNFTFSSNDINGGQLRFDRSKVTQDLADDYADAVGYIIDEPDVLDGIVAWNAIDGDYDKEEVYDLISDARVVSTNNDTTFEIVSNGVIIPLRNDTTWERAKEIYDKHPKYIKTQSYDLGF